MIITVTLPRLNPLSMYLSRRGFEPATFIAGLGHVALAAVGTAA